MQPSSGGTLGSEEPPDQGHLSRFVRDYLARTGVSERTLAEKSIDPVTTLRLKHGWMNLLVHARQDRAPELWRLRALAVGMGAPARRIVELAAAQWLGLDVAEVDTPSGSVVVTVPEDLSPEKRERFVRMAEDMARHLAE